MVNRLLILEPEKLAFLAQVALLALPIFFLSKRLERKIQPRKSIKHFLLWFVGVVVISIIWYLVGIWLYYKFIFHRH
jgi:hypothetical protein